VRFSGDPTFEGCVDNSIIADKFVQHFQHNNCDRMQALQYEYSKLSENHSGLPVSENIVFDTELVSKVIADLKTCKAADIAGLTSEHLLFSHPVIVSKLLNVVFQCQHVPAGFKYSYIVP